MSASKPITELRRDPHGVPCLSFYHLDGSQLAYVHGIMVRNGREDVYVSRANAGAHLHQWDAMTGRISIYLYGEDSRPFLRHLEEGIGVKIGWMPRQGYSNEALVNGHPVNE